MIALDCKRVQEKLFSFLDQELTLAEQKELEQHLNICPDCERECEKLQAVRDMLEEFGQAGVSLEESLPLEQIEQKARVDNRIRTVVLSLVVISFLGLLWGVFSYFSHYEPIDPDSFTVVAEITTPFQEQSESGPQATFLPFLELTSGGW